MPCAPPLLLLSRESIYRVCTRVSFVVVGHLGAIDRPIERDRTIVAHSHDCLERAAQNGKNEKIERKREREEEGGREEGREMMVLSLLSRVRPTKRTGFHSRRRNGTPPAD